MKSYAALDAIPHKLGNMGSLLDEPRQPAPGRVGLPTGGCDVPGRVRERVEVVTGADLSGVRMHAADAHAAALGARAFTIGKNIYMGAGQLGSSDADHLLAHELAHAAQQQGGTVHAQAKLRIGGESDPAEAEADAIADAALASTPTRMAITRSEPAVRCVRMTSAQVQRFNTVDNDLYAVASPFEDVLIGAAQEGTPTDLSKLVTEATAIDSHLAEIERLTADDTDPRHDMKGSAELESHLNDLHGAVTRASSVVDLLRNSNRVVASDEMRRLTGVFYQLSERATALRKTKGELALIAEKQGNNVEAARRLEEQARQTFGKRAEKDHRKGKIGSYASIVSSIEDLAKAGRLDGISDVLAELFSSFENNEKASTYDGSFFGMLGGKDKLDRLIGAALHNIAHPETIFQGTKGTCPAAVLEMLIAIEEPATYIRMVRQLASKDHVMKLPDDGVNTPTIRGPEKPAANDGSVRNPASRLMQPALMETMRLGEHYDNKKDEFKDSKSNKGNHGAEDGDLKFGSRLTLKRPLGGTTDELPTDGKAPRPAGFHLGKPGHEVLVVHADADFVYFVNSQLGRPEKMTRTEWEKLERLTLLEPGETNELVKWKQSLMNGETTWTKVTATDIFN